MFPRSEVMSAHKLIKLINETATNKLQEFIKLQQLFTDFLTDHYLWQTVHHSDIERQTEIIPSKWHWISVN